VLQAANVWVLIEGPANVFCDNHGVIKNVSIPESTLMKKHNAINYHASEVVRRCVASQSLPQELHHSIYLFQRELDRTDDKEFANTLSQGR
jgi:hypothetical protein